MISRIFIDRPVFAWVIAIVIMLAGVFGVHALSVEQYPDIAPPQVNIRANYPGASAEVLETSVTQVIEQQLTGIDGMLYFQSTSNSNGRVDVTVTLQKGINPDIAQVQVQNKVQQALPRLPQDVQQQGLLVTKANADPLMIIAIYDETDRATNRDISDYLVSNVQEPTARVAGVGDVQVFGAQHAMRIWLDPYKLASFNLMPGDVITALRAQNAQVAAGEVGVQPAPVGQQLNATVTAQGRLSTPEQFRAIVLKTDPSGAQVRLDQVARVEMGSENYNVVTRLNGHPSAGIAVLLAPGADALKTAELVKAEIAARARNFPAGYTYAYPNDATEFIKISIREVVQTLAVAIVLVVMVMFVFLQSWRATLIPAITIPVVMLGTFGVLAVAGFSINVLTLFALVLSIGLLVDDAIVVVENVERVMHENPGMSAREATIISMEQVQTALIAIALVLSAVFLPMAFFGGSVGVIYRQFSITIVSSMSLSVLVALVLSPALTATLMKPPQEHHHHNALDRLLTRFGGAFNSWFARTRDRYQAAVRRIIEGQRIPLVVYGVVCVALAVLFVRLPTSFLPQEDQGAGTLQYTLPSGAILSRTLDAAAAIEHYFMTEEAKNLAYVFTVNGVSNQGSGQNTGRGFMSYVPWDQRGGAANTAQAIARRATEKINAKLRDVQFYALNPPPIRGLGQSSGFTMELLNTTGLSREAFKARLDRFMGEAEADPAAEGVRLNALEDRPTLQITTDTQKAGALGVTQADINNTLSTAWGGTYVNDFVDRGRVKRVYVQGDAPYRARPEDLGNWYVRGASGAMAPFSSFAQIGWGQAPSSLQRFNGVPSYEIQGDAAAGRSTGQAMEAMSRLADKLGGVGVAWSGLSYQERLSGSQAPMLYAVSVLVVFLCLSALYESWSVPLAVLLVIPLGLVGATLAVTLRGLQNDVYFQVGLVTTMGLSAKNAILIVEFAEAAEKRGMSAFAAAMEGARLRLRPILMTSLSFIFGVLPLALASGAGAQSRMAIGTAVIGGMLTATALAIFFVPMFYVSVRRIFPDRRRRTEEQPA
jgi:multidrug efflux pump